MTTTTTFQVWYMKPSFFRDGIMGEKTTKLADTHVYLRDIELPGDSTQLQRIFTMMQAERWSPEGEGRALIESKGLQHTSMSVGDVIVVEGRACVVGRFGFDRLPDSVL